LTRSATPSLPAFLQLSFSVTASSDLFTRILRFDTSQGVLASHNQFRYEDGRPGTRVRNTYSGFIDNDTTDCHGHGTHVAATLGGLTFGVAKNITLHAVSLQGLF
jgi:hypothetical protein